MPNEALIIQEKKQFLLKATEGICNQKIREKWHITQRY